MIILCLLLLLSHAAESLYMGTTLDDCYAVARSFNNTCTQAPKAPAPWTSTFKSITQSCPDTRTFQLKSCQIVVMLCVSCSQNATTGQVRMRVQTNGLPRGHCYGGQCPAQRKIDFEVDFNKNVSMEKAITFRSNNQFDDKACSNMSLKVVPTWTNLKVYEDGHQMDDIAGIAINGGIIKAPIVKYMMDPYFPTFTLGRNFTQSPTFDTCLGFVDEQSTYGYIMLSPCISNSSMIAQNRSCGKDPFCSQDIKNHSLYFQNRQERVLGIAKDGHIIQSPFFYEGSFIRCTNLDQCGGYFMEQQTYVYTWSNIFPYSMTCFGPGSQPSVYTARCSENTCSGRYLMEVGLILMALLQFIILI
ncbi:hypothetical protein FGO68_gene12448 [Halteria grandinella]|uniref:Peptidase A1 domain-containing protein n=1 Tax=Halteria grandinella TaxID=5974 RepID=A0A8J8NL03_HALGN|nr:hypothetical protein FGO68_gene12448 [Halteria grandinella]